MQEMFLRLLTLLVDFLGIIQHYLIQQLKRQRHFDGCVKMISTVVIISS